MDDESRKNLRNIQIAYQMVFQGEAGVMVLSDILSMLGYFSNIPERIDPERIAVANTILSRLNVYNEDGVSNYVKTILGEAKPPVLSLEEENDDVYQI